MNHNDPETRDVVVVEHDDTATLPIGVGLQGEPEQVVADAAKAAAAITAVVEKQKDKFAVELWTGNEKRTYLRVEAWQTIARFYGLSARTVTASPVDLRGQEGVIDVTDSDGRVVVVPPAVGWEAYVEIVTTDGRIVGRGDAMCLRNEITRKRNGDVFFKWGEAPDFQIRSMAQTRAAGKGFRSVLGFVPVLAGYAATPAEEMDGVGNRNRDDDDKSGGDGGRPSSSSGGGGGGGHQRRDPSDTRVISKPQAKRFWALGKGAGHSDDDLREYVGSMGFERTDEITRGVYDQMCDRVQDATPLNAPPDPGDEREPGSDG